MTSSVERVIELMQTTFGPASKTGTFRTYYNGDPEVIPAFNLPCAIVTQTSDNTVEGAMGEDDVTDEIRIKLVFDKRDDYTGKIDPLNLTEKRLRDLVGARGEDFKYKPGTVKKMLREALLDGVTAVAPTIRVEYGVNPRETLKDSGNVAWTSEAWITFSIQSFAYTND
ncbi:hypothetical protein AB0P19_06930 [Microbacterium oleivorans]|uniref:hypothetical protein n=1 Tax=Microbacterium oleivorans TaxID=273677 RepID=UPI0033EC5C72